jgi:hypothetical protein
MEIISSTTRSIDTLYQKTNTSQPQTIAQEGDSVTISDEAIQRAAQANLESPPITAIVSNPAPYPP